MDLLVSYPWRRFYPMRGEVLRVLRRLGDELPSVRWTAVEGIAVVETILDNRQVIQQCRALFRNQTEPFNFAVKWVPVDNWCATDLTAIKQIIDTEVAPRIAPGQTWAMRVHKRRWQRYHTTEIVRALATDIDRPVNLSHPDWIVWVDVIGDQTTVSLLRPEEIFSVAE